MKIFNRNKTDKQAQERLRKAVAPIRKVHARYTFDAFAEIHVPARLAERQSNEALIRLLNGDE